jgi:hypothetical protein
MQDVLASLYELLHGTQSDPVYRDRIYLQAFTALIALTLAAAGVFYFVIGWVTARFILLRHWTLCLIASSLLNAAAASAVAYQHNGGWNLPLAAAQAFYAAAAFTAVSAIFKFGSPNARRTPW